MKKLAAALVALALAAPAVAQEAPPAGAVDMTKMGPMARPVTREKEIQKELKAWFAAYEEAGEKGDVEAMADMIDFPVMMMSDTMAGKFAMMHLDRASWVGMMKPFMDPEAMKDMKMEHSGKCYLMSDDLASCEGTVKMTVGKTKGTMNNHMIMTRVDGKWKAKSMMEAGWGDMSAPPGAGAPAPTP